MGKVKRLYPLKFVEETRVLDQNSIISNGFLADNSIDDIIETYLEDFLGREVFQYYKGEFPLRVSYLESEGSMPLQAHPNDFTALERYDSIGCAKIWYILGAEKDARICLGFSQQMDASRFYEGCLDGQLEKCLNFIEPKAGDCIYIEPGTVYSALGKIKYIEIAQNSKVTYHLYDLDKKTGSPQSGSGVADCGTAGADDFQMEIAEAIDVINYTPFDAERCLFRNVSGNLTIADTSDFIVKMNMLGKAAEGAESSNWQIEVSPEALESFVALLCLKGSAMVKDSDGNIYPIAAGEFMLLPANLKQAGILPAGDNGAASSDDNGQAVIIQAYMPQFGEQEDLYMNYYEDDSDYPEGSGVDPEDEEFEDEECDDDCCDDECCCDDDCSGSHECCGGGSHAPHDHGQNHCLDHHDNHSHNHHHTTGGYFAQSAGSGVTTANASNDEMFDLEKIHREEKEMGIDNSNERFFRR